MAKALWIYMVTGEFGLHTIFKPSIAVRELRKLFTYHNLLNRQIRMIKNGFQAMLTENGIKLEEADRKPLLKKNGDSTITENLDLALASVLIMNGELELLRSLLERKEKLTEGILLAGATFQKQVELLITIRGITPLVSLAFLAGIGDINRFPSTRKMNAYFGLVPQCSDSGGKERHGHISKESRKLTRTILTQTLV
jgi:transposase